MCEYAAACDARALHIGSYGAWLTKVKSSDARAKWLSSSTKRYFTIDFNSQLFFYSQKEDRKTNSLPVQFKDIICAEHLPRAAQPTRHSSEHTFGFTVKTTDRVYELYTITYLDATHWVDALNAARDLAAVANASPAPPGPSVSFNSTAPAVSSSFNGPTATRELSQSSLSTMAGSSAAGSEPGGHMSLPPAWATPAPKPAPRTNGYPFHGASQPPQAMDNRQHQHPVQAGVAGNVDAAPATPADPFAALDALEELAGPPPETPCATGSLSSEMLHEARLVVAGSKRAAEARRQLVAPTEMQQGITAALLEAPAPAPAAPAAPMPESLQAQYTQVASVPAPAAPAPDLYSQAAPAPAPYMPPAPAAAQYLPAAPAQAQYMPPAPAPAQYMPAAPAAAQYVPAAPAPAPYLPAAPSPAQYLPAAPAAAPAPPQYAQAAPDPYAQALDPYAQAAAAPASCMQAAPAPDPYMQAPVAPAHYAQAAPAPAPLVHQAAPAPPAAPMAPATASFQAAGHCPAPAADVYGAGAPAWEPARSAADSWDEPGPSSQPAPVVNSACGAPLPPAASFVAAKHKVAATAQSGDDLDDLVGEMLATGGGGAGHALVEGFHCTGCDFQVMRIDDFIWDGGVDYMFFRNNYPTFEKLRKRLQRQPGCVAYCCQCSWKSADRNAELVDVAEGLRWRIVTF